MNPQVGSDRRHSCLGRTVASAFLLFFCAVQALAVSPPVTFKGVVNVLNTTGASSVTSVVTDASGTVYVADTAGDQVIKVTPDGNASPLAISGLTPALSSPTGLAISPVSGNLYVVDGGNLRIVRVDPATGSASVVPTPGYTLANPTGIAVDTADNVFVADASANRILKITSSGAATVLSTTSGTDLSGYSAPRGLAVDTYGNLYIAYANDSVVVKVTAAAGDNRAGSLLLLSLAGPSAVAASNDGTLYVSNTGGKNIKRLGPTGETILPTGSTILNSPFGVAVSPMGKVYVADNGTNQVLSIEAGSVGFGHVQRGNSGTPITLPFTISGTTTLTSVTALTNGTEGLDFTIAANSGTACTTGSSGIDCTVNVKFTPTAPGLRRGALVLNYTGGSLTVPLYGIGDAPIAALSPNTATVVSTGAVTTENPYQIASDGTGNLYISSFSGKKVVKLAAVGGAASVIDIGTPGGVANRNLTGVAIDGAGNLFIGDQQNNRILVMTPEGTISVLNISGVSPGLPTALAFDAAGNLYVGNLTIGLFGRIIKVSSLVVTGSTATGQGKVLNTGSYGFSRGNLTGMAVDSKGTVYIAARMENNSQIIRVTASGAASVVSTPGVTLIEPQGVAVDGMDNLYIVDYNGRIVQVTTAGVASVVSVSGLPSPQSTLGLTMFGVTSDPFGNLLIADYSNNRVVKVDVSGARLMFANANTGSTSTDSPKTATVTNLGNQDLAFSANPTYTANFSEDTATVSPVTSSTVLTPGTSGNVGVKFTPQSAGNLSANITLTNNSLNVSGTTQQIAVSGTATYPGDTTSVTVVPTPSSLKLGQLFSISATVSDTTSGHTATIPTGSVFFTYTVSNTTQSRSVALDSTGTASLSDVTLFEVGTHTITATYGGVDGSFLSSSNTATVTVSKADVVLSGPASVPVQVTVGQAGSVPVTVVGVRGGGAPTGTINYDLLNSSNVSVTSASLPLTVGTSSSTATVPLAGTLEPGSYTLRVSYGGNDNYAPSASQTIPLSVNKVTPVLTLTTSSNPALVTSAVTFTATAPSQATGNVVFYDGTTALGTVALSQGTAAYTTSSLTAGTHSITAAYSGDSSYSPVTSAAVSQGVNKATTVLTLTSSSNPALVTSAVTFTATIAPQATGNVVFYDGTTALGTVALTQGTAAFTTSSLSAATHSIMAAYSGDSSYSLATSAAVSQVVNKATAVLALTTSANPALVTTAVTFTATTTPAATGNVVFYDGTTALGTVALTQGTAAYTTSSLTAGTHSITAAYSGDSSYSPATSAAVSQVVNKATTVLTLTSSANPALVTSAVTFTATAPSQATGNVVFYDGTTALGTVALTQGTAAYTTSSLTAGTHSITAVYSGDSSYSPATSAAVSQGVNKATAVLALTTSANPALVTTAVTFTATIAPAATGNVVFYDGTTALGTVALTQGTAAFTTSSLSAATHSITADYSGDSSYSPVTSSAVAQVVTDYTVSGSTTGGSGGATGTVPTQVVSPGGTALFNVALTSTVTSGALPLPAPMTLTVTDNLPLGSVVMLTAPGMTGGRTLTLPAGASAGGVQLQVQLPRQSAGLQRGNPLTTLPFAFGILMLPFGGKLGRAAGKRVRRSGLLLLLTLLGLMTIAGLSGCGAVNSGALAEQNYTITVTATSGTLSHSTTFNLTVR